MFEHVDAEYWNVGNNILAGADPKLWVTNGKDKFLVKHGQSRFPLEPYSEYVASKFISLVGLPVQTVSMYYYHGQLQAFCGDIGEFRAYSDITTSSLFQENRRALYSLPDIMYEISYMTKLTVEQRLSLMSFVRKQFVVDAILGNGDRHAGNWGYTYLGKPVSIYDNGAALAPNILKISKSFSSLYDLLAELVLNSPASCLVLDTSKGKNQTFYTMFGDIRLLRDELKWIKDIYSVELVYKAVSGLPVAFARFYTYYITLRVFCIIYRISFKKAFSMLDTLQYEVPKTIGEFVRDLRI